MRIAFGLVLAGALGVVGAGCGGSGPNGAAAPSTPDGTYLITGREMFGEKETPEEIAEEPEDRRTIKFSDGKISVVKGMKKVLLDVAFDPSRDPPHITATDTDATGRKTTSYGIYKIEGDILTLCLVAEGEGEEVRPKEFETAAGSAAVLLTLEKR